MQCNLCGYSMSAFDKECPRCHGRGIRQPQPTPAATGYAPPISAPTSPDWFYSQNGQRIGPLPQPQMGQLIISGAITTQTPVWCHGLPDWTPAGSTVLASLFANRNCPPALPASEINNTVVWVIAFAPILGYLMMCFLAGFFNTNENNFWWTTLALNFGLCFLDERNLEKAGHDTSGMGIWSMLLVPVYLFTRASKFNHSNAYAIVWLVTFILMLGI